MTNRDHDWQPAGWCPNCGRAWLKMRRGNDYAEQRTCPPRCPRASRPNGGGKTDDRRTDA